MGWYWQKIWCLRQKLATLCLLFATFPASARKGNEPVYIDAFDIAAGGASLTKASKDGRMYANPALMVYGGQWHRWLGLTTTTLTTPETVSTVKKVAQGAAGSSEDSQSNNDFVKTVLENPLHFGWLTALGYVSANVALGAFSRFEPDIRVRQFGQHGLPQLEFRAESYHGVASAFALRSPWRWLSFGLTMKYIFALEPELKADLVDQEAIKNIQPSTLSPDPTRHYHGVGMDAGMLWFFQGRYLDWSVASKVDDIGGVSFQQGRQPAADAYIPQNFRQVVSVGLGATLHTSADALHFAVDYRDALNAYQDDLFKKVYAGVKLMMRTYIGLGVGIYHGYPSAGVEIDLILLRLGLTTYTREFGDHPGVDPRRIVMGSVSTGF